MERKLATIRKIDDISPIEGADKIECATVGGWKTVVKKGDFKAGEKAVFCEIDSWIPHNIAPFLCRGKTPREYNGVPGERLKTVKLRGQLSQGLLLPLTVIPESRGYNQRAIQAYMGFLYSSPEGEDVTEILGIQKWERPIPAQLSGITKGYFPSFLRKTDQERVQNLSRELERGDLASVTYEVSEKLDGSSCTIYIKDGEVGVCSRKLDLKETEENTFWNTAHASGAIEWIKGQEMNIALQGELIGPGVQGNKYNLSKHEFRVFDVWDIDDRVYLTPTQRHIILIGSQLKQVPVVRREFSLVGSDMGWLLKLAEGNSALNPNMEREGLVFKPESGGESFKAISNKFLLKGGE